MSIDYSKLEEITVKSQEELDAIPDDFAGRIYIEFGTYWNKAIVRRRYRQRVVLRENSSAELWGNSSAELWKNSSAVLWGNSSAVLWKNSSAVLWENSSAVLWGNSSAELWGNSSAELWENSSAVLWENSSAVLWENSSAEASGNAQVVDRLRGGRIEITGNARIVYMPKTIEEYCAFYGIEHTKKKGKFFKAVRKTDGRYFSDRNSKFEYVIGKKVVADGLDTDVTEDCGKGIHIAHKAWCLNYGRRWKDLAILEVEADLSSIILPNGCPGKVRCKEVKVVREVPLEECGVYGKILAKNRKSEEGADDE